MAESLCPKEWEGNGDGGTVAPVFCNVADA